MLFYNYIIYSVLFGQLWRSQVCGGCSLRAPAVSARLAPALLHHHHPLLPDSGAAAQGNGGEAGPDRGAAGAGGPAPEGPRRPGARPGELPLRRDEQRAALAEAQLVVHGRRLAPVRRHALRRRGLESVKRLKIKAVRW